MNGERIKFVPEDPSGADNVTVLIDGKELLHAQILQPKDVPPYFQVRWPLNESLQDVMTYIRSSYHRLNQVFSGKPFHDADFGHAEIVRNGDHYSVLDLDSFLSPKPIFNDCTRETTDSVAVFTSHLNYFIEEHATKFNVEGRNNLAEEIISLLLNTSKITLTNTERARLLDKLNSLYGNLPQSVT